MSAPTRLSTSTSTRFELQWTAPASDGGSTILSYFLEWDAGTNGVSWTEVVGYSPLSTATTYSVTGGTLGLTAGNSYGFRVSAYNIHGWGLKSSVASLKAAMKPSTITSITTSIDSISGDLVINWSTPNSNGDDIF